MNKNTVLMMLIQELEQHHRYVRYYKSKAVKGRAILSCIDVKRAKEVFHLLNLLREMGEFKPVAMGFHGGDCYRRVSMDEVWGTDLHEWLWGHFGSNQPSHLEQY